MPKRCGTQYFVCFVSTSKFTNQIKVNRLKTTVFSWLQFIVLDYNPTVFFFGHKVEQSKTYIKTFGGYFAFFEQSLLLPG